MKTMLMKKGSSGNGGGSSSRSESSSKSKHKFKLDSKTLLKIYDLMVKSRALEERLIKMYKQADGYFWIGGPGEEAFNIPLGLQVKKGEGLDHDFLHLHYRSSGIITAMGGDPANAMRQMKNTASDPYSGGRNFSNHYSIKKWNVVPVSSTIGTQYATAIGTGIAQTKKNCKGITIVNGGDAGSAEGEFASCLIWSSRPMMPLPNLIIVANNSWGISTSADGQHGEKDISDRARAFNMPAVTINGNDVEESWFAIKEAMEYVRTERKPYFVEFKCSRLYGHSSASGANFVAIENDCLKIFEAQLESAGVMSPKDMKALREKYDTEFLDTWKKVRQEPLPDGSTIYDHTYAGQKGKTW